MPYTPDSHPILEAAVYLLMLVALIIVVYLLFFDGSRSSSQSAPTESPAPSSAPQSPDTRPSESTPDPCPVPRDTSRGDAPDPCPVPRDISRGDTPAPDTPAQADTATIILSLINTHYSPFIQATPASHVYLDLGLCVDDLLALLFDIRCELHIVSDSPIAHFDPRGKDPTVQDLIDHFTQYPTA